MKLKSIIIDDELHNQKNLKLLLEMHCPEVLVLAMASSADEGLSLITEHQPDLVFLDIEMPRKNGFSMLEDLQEVDFEVIFVTAYNKYVLKAIRSCALDYLMKPVVISELQQAVQNVLKVVEHKKENHKLKTLVENLKNNQGPKKIALSTADELFFVAVDDIIRCKGENNYTMFFLTDKRSILVSRTLKEWDELLSAYGFIRTHQSHLVNKKHVKSYVKRDGGYILMEDGSTVSVSKYKKEETLRELAS
ncbi:LytR/AlgR family response regulator transcription factor [Formosa undariae]|uniref:LytR/AlgR family response regulator transcription factor n=1 Tax=Formosa undariae TaxID=1325436 RepID=A0ABV5F430_9FLAO